MVFEQEGHVTRGNGEDGETDGTLRKGDKGVAGAALGAPYLQGAGEVPGPQRPGVGRLGARLPLERKRGVRMLTAALLPSVQQFLAPGSQSLTVISCPSTLPAALEAAFGEKYSHFTEGKLPQLARSHSHPPGKSLRGWSLGRGVG